MAASPSGFEKEAAALREQFSDDTPISLVGANPFALPCKRLHEYLAIARRYFPRVPRISIQARILDIREKSAEELKALREQGLTHLYIGTENGHDEELKLLNKGNTTAEAVEQLLRLTRPAYATSYFYVLGMGGKGMGRASGLATVRLFSQVHPELVTTTGMTVFEGTPLADMLAKGLYEEASEREKIEELRVFLQELTVDTYYDGTHYLNPLSYRFANSDREEKARVLADIDDVLAICPDDEIELMVSRSQMRRL